MLTRRLNALVDAGLLERRRYSERPPRDEYVPTARGRDFRPVLIALLAWGNKHFAPEGASVQLVDTETGATVDPIMVAEHPATRLPAKLSRRQEYLGRSDDAPWGHFVTRNGSRKGASRFVTCTSFP